MVTLFGQHALAAEEGAAAVQGVAALGLSGWALLWQLLNFIILLGLLRIFVYPRILKVLESRRQTIAEGLTTAAEMKKAREELQHSQQLVLEAARQEAHGIIEESRKASQQMVLEGQAEARAQAQTIIEAAHGEITQSVELAKRKLKREAVQLVAVATEQIIKQRLDGEGDEQLITAALDEAASRIRVSKT